MQKAFTVVSVFMNPFIRANVNKKVKACPIKETLWPCFINYFPCFSSIVAIIGAKPSLVLIKFNNGHN